MYSILYRNGNNACIWEIVDLSSTGGAIFHPTKITVSRTTFHHEKWMPLSVRGSCNLYKHANMQTSRSSPVRVSDVWGVFYDSKSDLCPLQLSNIVPPTDMWRNNNIIITKTTSRRWSDDLDNTEAGYDCRLAPSQWETPLQSNAVSHWLGANLESALWDISRVDIPHWGQVTQICFRGFGHHWFRKCQVASWVTNHYINQ